MSDSPIVMHPHIYKDGQILSFKQLNEGVDPNPTHYNFSGHLNNKSLSTLISSTNNLNQITGRILLGIYGLLSYFGISKDPSENLSKTPSVFNQFHHLFQKGGLEEEIFILLKKQNEKIEVLEAQLDVLSSIRNEVPISRNEVLDFTSKLDKIEDFLRKIIG